MICYIQGSLACHTRFVRNKYSEKSDISITASSWSGTVAFKKAGINWEWKGEGDRNSHTWRNRSLPHLSFLQGAGNDVCEAAASQRCSDAARPRHSWSWGLAALTSSQKPLWEMTPSPSVLTAGLFPGTHGRAVPRCDPEQAPITGQSGEALPRQPRPSCSKGTGGRWTINTWTAPSDTAHSLTELPSLSPHLPNDSVNSQVIQKSRKVDTGQARAFLFPTYHSLQYFTCFAFSRWEQTVSVLVLHTGWKKHEGNNANCTHYLQVQGQLG